jgi:hypothetical protein
MQMEAAHVTEICQPIKLHGVKPSIPTMKACSLSFSLSLSIFAIVTNHILRQSGKMPAHTEYLQNYLMEE